MTRAEMMARMSSRELNEWIAFYRLEPFGGETQYIGHAITAATVANANRGKNQKAAKLDDFMPKFNRRAQTIEEQIQFAAMLTAAMGGTDAREDG